MNVKKQPFSVCVKHFSLTPNIVDFVGHAVALHTNDEFFKMPIEEMINRCRLYMNSVGVYGDSPFIYPIYGLAGIPEGFSRKCAIYGGTFMLNRKVDKFLFDEKGMVTGFKSGEEVAKAPMIICSPSYVIEAGMPELVKSVGKVIRCICIMDHPIPDTGDLPSLQIIIPQMQVNRKNSTSYVH